MYPRNAASPERIAIGAVVQISDGAVQTSGVSIKVVPQGGAAGAGGGTTGYEEGIVHYIPTQAETNYASFMVIAYKTGCIPVAQTIVTSKSATTGYAGIDWGQVTGASTTVNLSGTTIATTQQVDVNTIKTQTVTCAAGVTVLASVGTAATSTAQTGDAFARLGAPAGASISADVAAVKVDTAAILADTGTDGVVVAAGSKTGYSLSATQTFDLTGNITGNLSGSVNSVTTGVTVTTNNDKTGYALSATGSAAMTEGYAALGAAATLPQLLYEVRALLAEKSISSTTLTTKKLDGSTTAATYTLDDATTPSAITRAS